jgi:hypothetical protein
MTGWINWMWYDVIVWYDSMIRWITFCKSNAALMPRMVRIRIIMIINIIPVISIHYLFIIYSSNNPTNHSTTNKPNSTYIYIYTYLFAVLHQISYLGNHKHHRMTPCSWLSSLHDYYYRHYYYYYYYYYQWKLYYSDYCPIDWCLDEALYYCSVRHRCDY